jgi:hypothetical protein
MGFLSIKGIYFFFVFGTVLHLESFQQHFFVIFFSFFEIGSHERFTWGWLQTAILLIAAS